MQKVIGFNWPSPVTAKQSAKYIRVMNYNVHFFTRFEQFGDTAIKKKMMQLIKQQQPDIICFEEFYTRYKGSYATIDTLKRILNTPYYHYGNFNNQQASYGLSMGMAIFSKYPIVNTGVIRFSHDSSDTNAIFADLKIQNQIVRCYCAHLQSYGFESTDYEYLHQMKHEGHPTGHAIKRLLSKMCFAFKKRSEQTALLKQHASTCTTPYIIAGDFNDTPLSYTVTQLSDGLTNAFEQKGTGLVSTYNGAYPNFQIDYILLSKPFKVINYHVLHHKLSDHYPVMTDVELPWFWHPAYSHHSKSI